MHVGGYIHQLLPIIHIPPNQISSERYVERDETYDLLHGVIFSANQVIKIGKALPKGGAPQQDIIPETYLFTIMNLERNPS